MTAEDETSGEDPRLRIHAFDRRSILGLLCTGTLFPILVPASDSHCASSALDSNFKNYTFVFFTPSERALLDTAMEIIIPADEHSAGASEARVPAFADLMVSSSDDLTKQTWRRGLALLEESANSSSLETVLAALAAREANPQTELQKFFSILKLMTVRGYYTSWIGIHQDMQYEGNEYRASAPACNHPEHISEPQIVHL